jgi:hypothetical protein
MQILVAITILSFSILLWTATAITRRMRAGHKLERSTLLRPNFSTDDLTATEGTLTSEVNLVQHQELQNGATHMGWSISSSYPHQNA